MTGLLKAFQQFWHWLGLNYLLLKLIAKNLLGFARWIWVFLKISLDTWFELISLDTWFELPRVEWAAIQVLQCVGRLFDWSIHTIHMARCHQGIIMFWLQSVTFQLLLDLNRLHFCFLRILLAFYVRQNWSCSALGSWLAHFRLFHARLWKNSASYSSFRSINTWNTEPLLRTLIFSFLLGSSPWQSGDIAKRDFTHVFRSSLITASLNLVLTRLTSALQLFNLASEVCVNTALTHLCHHSTSG